MPKGKLLATEQDQDVTAVRNRMLEQWKTHKVVEAGSWGKRVVG